MMENTNISQATDGFLLKIIGDFIRHHRLQQNKTQQQLANDAGINRSTLSEFERGEKSSIDTFIRLLRVLDLLYILNNFRIEPQISPIQLAEMQLSYRRRASRPKKQVKKPKSDW